ncbi:MAG: ABC transporter permease [Verrucomicrobiaceae bacterium]|nr:ABC transporter permease [Verrucomicrobiaceae bacterium]
MKDESTVSSSAGVQRPGLLTPGASRRPWWAWWRRKRGTGGSMTASTSILPVLIEVFAGFSKLDGDVEEEEIESSLGYLRYDYPDAIYTELRRLYSEALQKPQDLNHRATELSRTLTMEQKILLSVQLYLLISRNDAAASNRRQMVEFYLFMTNLGIAAQAIDVVYQLNSGDRPDSEEFGNKGAHPLEVLRIAREQPCDVLLRSLQEGCVVTAYRYQNLVLLKNTGSIPILVRSRRQPPGEFSRLYPGERVVMGDVSLDYNDLISYFNAKKTLSGTQLYLTLTESGDAEIAPQRQRGTNLRVSFGLGVTVEALRDTDASLGGRTLTAGTTVEASIEDSIIAQGEVEISLLDLRRRAREFGSQFRLEGSRNVYLVSNKPELLEEGDILLSESTQGEVLLRIECNYADKTGYLEVLKSGRPVIVGLQPVSKDQRVFLQDGETITLGEGQYLRCHFADRIIEEERNIIRSVELRDVIHWFEQRERDLALDGISLSARRGEMVCVMGPSGCGKSTLLRALGGHLRCKGGEVLMNGISLYDHSDNLTPYVAYIPQEDAFDPLLKVQENLDFSVAVRCPHLKVEDRRKRVDAKLAELGLGEMRHRLAGTPQQKYLSGGERKRLNAGLDMIGISDVYLFDEPTSGLSSKDSEHVLEIIRSLARNKIVFASIHQPSMRLLRMFDKALLLDKGGRMAFYGTPTEMLAYFWRVYQEETGSAADEGEVPAHVTPDFVFDVLETPLRDIDGDIILEQNAEGHLVPARRFPPNFWRDRFQTHRLMQSMAATGDGGTGTFTTAPVNREDSNLAESRRHAKLPEPPKHRLREELILFGTMLRRAFLSKLRNRANLLTTVLEAPALAVLISMVLRYSEEDSYTFASAFHIPTYLFMSLVVAMFLGLTNSADDIIRDRAMLNRERNHNLRTFYYIAGKITALASFALLQCVIYLAIGNWILELRDMFLVHLGWMFATSLTGACMGLLISSLVNDSRTALNAIPLLLIPQIILGGALIKYEEMNKNLDFVYSIQRYIKPAEEGGGESPSKLKVPFICQLMPLRWTYEAMLISQARMNPLTSTQDLMEERIQYYAAVGQERALTDDESKQFDLLKQSLAVVSGLHAREVGDVPKHLKAVAKALKTGKLDQELIEYVQRERRGTSAEDLYVNRKVLDLVTKAEMEREDYRRKTSPNVFFGLEKEVVGFKIKTVWLNFWVVVVFVIVIVAALQIALRKQMTKV